MGPVSNRLGYTTSPAVYLPANVANGITVRIDSGTATLYRGLPNASSHSGIITLTIGESHVVSGLATGEVLSVQGGIDFAWRVTVPAAPPAPPPGTASQQISLTCTGSPCPWGSSLTSHAAVWPAAENPTTTRLGYTASAGIYLPASVGNRTTVKVVSGSATLYAGAPGASSHRALVTLSGGQQYSVTELLSDEVLSAQGDSSFTYEVTIAPAPPPPPPGAPGSQFVTWTCTGTDCPWGATSMGHALVWPAAGNPITARLGYTTSAAVYLPRSYANGATVTIVSGTATLYAGLPYGPSHRAIVALTPGDAYTVSELTTGEVLSVQSSAAFTYNVTLGPGGGNDDPPDDPGDPPDPNDGSIGSVDAIWRCNIPACTGGDWVSHVLTWPSNSAYSNNARSGEASRTVYAPSGELLYPYMGSWADGCQVEVTQGTVIIIEWQRGTNVWRETWLEPGDTHTINLVGVENGAMIESYDGSPGFRVKLSNCTPQPLP